MSNFIARVNNETEYTIIDFNPAIFINQMTLSLVTDDLREVKQLFGQEFFLEILSGDQVIGEYSCFDGYSYISVKPNIYVESLNAFADILEIYLTRKNLIDTVDDLYKKVNNIVDTESMSLEEYKAYKLSQISEACQTDIYSGDNITFEDGITAHFSFTLQDQQDLNVLFNLACAMPNLRYPWHADSEDCRLYRGVDIIKIYADLQGKLLYTTTYCNAINQCVRVCSTKEQVDQFYYGCEIPEPYATNMEEILSAMEIVFNTIKSQYGIDQEDEDEPEDNQDPEVNNGDGDESGDSGEDPTNNSGENDSGENEPEDDPEGDPEVINE